MSLTPSAHFPVSERLRQTRAIMQREGIDALLVPSADPHLSEYLPEHWQARQWLSGFHGSVGTLIVTADFAGLWADSRYWEQAQVELAGSGIELVKLMAGQPGPLDWLGLHMPAGATVAVDGAVMAVAAARQLREKLQHTGASLRTDIDLFAEVWLDRPALPEQAVYAHLPPYAARERAEKLKALRDPDSMPGRSVAFAGNPRRYRLAVRSARFGRPLQSGLRRLRVDRRGHGNLVHSTVPSRSRTALMACLRKAWTSGITPRSALPWLRYRRVKSS